jgi:glycosyltransferase involved in cell wall biosynthesis
MFIRDDNTIWIISELYYPEETSTGMFMTEIAEGLAKYRKVKALTTQPTYSKKGIIKEKKEYHNNVEIFRCSSSLLNKNKILFKIINMLIFSCSIFINLLYRLKRGDIVLVVTNPPSLPIISIIASKIMRANCIIKIEDVYPNVLSATGVLKSTNYIYKFIDKIIKITFNNSSKIIVLGRDMGELVKSKINNNYENIIVISNWAETNRIWQEKKSENKLLKELGVMDKFIIQWAGNMGYPHDIETILGAIEKVKDIDDIHFIFIGSGAKRVAFDYQINMNNYKNVTLLGPKPREEQQVFLNACDVGLSSLVKGMAGISVPSRMYNLFLLGKPIISISEKNSEISLIINEYKIGYVIEPGNVQMFVDIILNIKNNNNEILEMGQRARKMVTELYTTEHILKKYIELINAC